MAAAAPHAAHRRMNAPAITPAVSRLHALAWRPGAEMHPGWWAALDLADWQDRYAQPACRAPIDRLIVARRGFPQAALPARLDPIQTALVALEPRLDALLVALGLLAHGRPDYLVMQPYRAAFADRLGERGCAQLLALGHARPVRGPDLAPEQCVDALHASGARWWHAEAATCIATRLLCTALPPSSFASPIATAPADNLRDRASDWLLTIGRFL
jgi:hypothetical protein